MRAGPLLLPNVVGVLLLGAMLPAARAAELKLLLPLGRTAYQTNEVIDVSVVRSADGPLKSGLLTLVVAGDDGSRASFDFPAPAQAIEGNSARATLNLHLNGWLLRPGRYALQVACDGASAEAGIDVHSHVRQSTFKTLQWASRAGKGEQQLLGEEGLGFNLIYTAYGGLEPDELIRTGADYMWCCTMSGGHQMDLRTECDWSDPYVLRGGAARVVRRALQDRTRPNAVGVHYYDEPGLTWWKHPATGVMVPYNIPSQDRAFQAVFKTDPPQYQQVDESDPANVARWKEMNRWKLGFMEAAWKFSAFGVSQVRADLISATQSAYGATAYADGYYFNVVRSLPVISGHGGYDDYGLLYFNPGYAFQLGRMRQLDRPNWYLPMWYGNEPAERARMEQYLSFMDNLQGMGVPPDQTVQKPGSTPATEGIVESNLLMARLGTIFTTMPVDRGDVAVLYSLSQALDAEVKDLKKDINRSAYEGGGHTRNAVGLVYLASRMLQTQIYPIVEEDVLDGTLAAHYKAIVLPGIQALDPRVIKALESFAASGGLVLVSDESAITIAGSKKLGAPTTHEIFAKISELWPKAQQDKAAAAELDKWNNVGAYYRAAEPLAHALQTRLNEHGIRPAFYSSSREVTGTRQAWGDIEYVFAVNATFDPHGGDRNAIRATAAELALAADGRPIYDAIHGQAATQFESQGDRMAGKFRFGAGQMRVFARTARPIGGVQVFTTLVSRDLTAEQNPIKLQINAALVDADHQVLVGSAPLRVRVLDPSGGERYDLYRATDRGLLQLTLPLAANDPPGKWRVVVEELLNHTQASGEFLLSAPTQCGALAGRVPRAMSFGNDRENIFRFFRTFQDVTLVKGASDFAGPAAERLAKNLAPWGIRAKIVAAADVAKPRPITAEEARTWVGLNGGRVEAGDKHPPDASGFNVEGPVILLGNPADNPLIKFALDNNFLPYKPEAELFPGRGRGLLAWQRDCVGYGQESICLIAFDAAGIDEAVGSSSEDIAALTPLTRWEPPNSNEVVPASKTLSGVPEAKIVWRALLPDRAVALKAEKGGQIALLSLDGTLSQIDSSGKIIAQQLLSPDEVRKSAIAADAELLKQAEQKQSIAGLLVKHASPGTGRTAIAYWGGTLRIVDAAGAVKFQQRLAQDIAALAWSGDTLLAALSDGQLVALETK